MVVVLFSEGVFDVREEMTVDHAIMQVLTESGHTALLCYILQQIQQFQLHREDFAMQHTAVEYMDEVSEELKASVIAAIPAEERLRGLSPEERRRLRDLLDQDPSK